MLSSWSSSFFVRIICTILFSFFAQALRQSSSDEVKSLPGWNGDLPSRIFSGLLPAGMTPDNRPMSMHYIFVESEGDPKNDPVLVWSNGGPGAGSEFGLFTELGPFALSDQSLLTPEYNRTKIPTLYQNDFSWTKHASVLMYDSPPPVGFSYCGDDVNGDGYSCGDWNDERTSLAAYTFMKNWIREFSDFASNELYLSGES